MTARTKRRALWGGLLGATVIIAVIAVVARSDEECFIRAVQDGDAVTVAAFLNKRGEFAQLELPNKGGGTTPVLDIALRRGRNEVVRLLLAHGAAPGRYPGILVCAQNVETAELLMKYGADVNQRGKYNGPPLHFFATHDGTSIAESLIAHGADIDLRSESGETPLHWAAREGCLNGARLLVSRGADVHARAKNDKTPLDCAVMPVWSEDACTMRGDRIRRCQEVGNYLLSCGSTCTAFDLAWLGDRERLAQQLAADPSLANGQTHGEPLLFMAIRGGNADIVEYLLSRGAQVGVVGRFRQTPLQVAAYIGHDEVAEVLLNHGVAVNERGPWGETALHWAAFKGNTAVAALLLRHGADPNVQTTAHVARLNLRDKDRDPVERELKWFAIREMQRKRPYVQVMALTRPAFTAGDTPLHVAAYWNHADIVELLVAAGADVNKSDGWGATPLHRAAASGYGDGHVPGGVAGFADVARQLLAAGADPLAKTPNGLTAVELARRIKNKELVQLLTPRKRL